MTGKCHEVADLLFGYAEGDLDAPGAERVERHIRACPLCEQKLQEFHRLLAFREGVPTPPPLRTAVLASLSSDPNGRTDHRRLFNLRFGRGKLMQTDSALNPVKRSSLRFRHPIWQAASLSAAVLLGAGVGFWCSRKPLDGGTGLTASKGSAASRSLLSSAEVFTLFNALKNEGLTEEGKFKIQQFVRERAKRVIGVAILNPQGEVAYAYPNSEKMKGVLLVPGLGHGNVQFNGKALLGYWKARKWGARDSTPWTETQTGHPRVGLILERKTSGEDAYPLYQQAQAAYNAGRNAAAAALVRRAVEGWLEIQVPPFDRFATLRDLARKNSAYALDLARHGHGREALEVNQLTHDIALQLQADTLAGNHARISDLVAVAMNRMRDDTLERIWSIRPVTKARRTTAPRSPNPPGGKG
jgi:hypothetical protein